MESNTTWLGATLPVGHAAIERAGGSPGASTDFRPFDWRPWRLLGYECVDTVEDADDAAAMTVPITAAQIGLCEICDQLVRRYEQIIRRIS
jgi:hypothetical protein